ncbi:hypothetical protein [Actinokineospora bangkokensis]|uniref:Uncharacterized protein n=1 Tax=Actinokineospora bangkokensis TaxID=1193682 RepID=A0A1Q9LRM3_9PSEU|nr:hypothetical protein [Actinokineospora bangkokensis]OLR94672.1 hypothetical protein BJP25_13210 [Actinokineospora bangkokensis]
MADENTPTPVPPAALKAAAGFVRAHGKPSRAVVEPIGRVGARVVLVGKDGAMGDVIVPSAETGDALVEKVRDLEPAEWNRETVSGTKIGSAHRAKMAARGRG